MSSQDIPMYEGEVQGGSEETTQSNIDHLVPENEDETHVPMSVELYTECSDTSASSGIEEIDHVPVGSDTRQENEEKFEFVDDTNTDDDRLQESNMNNSKVIEGENILCDQFDDWKYSFFLPS